MAGSKRQHVVAELQVPLVPKRFIQRLRRGIRVSGVELDRRCPLLPREGVGRFHQPASDSPASPPRVDEQVRQHPDRPTAQGREQRVELRESAQCGVFQSNQHDRFPAAEAVGEEAARERQVARPAVESAVGVKQGSQHVGIGRNGAADLDHDANLNAESAGQPLPPAVSLKPHTRNSSEGSDMRRIHGAAAGLLTAAVMATFVACSSDNGTGGNAKIDLSGSYTLVQLLLATIIPAPGSTGTLVATADSVHANISIVSPDTSIVHDTTLALSGSYLAKQAGGKDSIYVVLGGALGTVPGSFTITGAAKDTLSLTLLTPAGSFKAIWHKN